MHENETVFVGIDVSKAHLDVGIYGEAEVRRVMNDEGGIQGLVSEFAQLSGCLVVMEATGGFEMPVAAALAAAHVPVVIANPRQTRDFVRSSMPWSPDVGRSSGGSPKKRIDWALHSDPFKRASESTSPGSSASSPRWTPTWTAAFGAARSGPPRATFYNPCLVWAPISLAL